MTMADEDRGTPRSEELEVYTPDEVAKLLKVKKSTLSSWRTRDNTGPEYIKMGRHVRYTHEAVEAYVEAQAEKSRALRLARNARRRAKAQR